MKAVITGIQGFVGGHLAQHLLAEGDQVLGCSRRARWSKDAPSDVAGAVPLIAWDIADRQGFSLELEQRMAEFEPDCLYHLAALSVPEDCGRDDPTAAAWATNVAGTEAVLELAASLPRPPRVLFVSSSHVYAPVPWERPLVTEASSLEPRSAYGRTKLAGEQLALEQGREADLEVVVARAFQHTGPRQDGRMMLPSWARQFVQDDQQAVEIYTREAGIDLTDVRDVVRAYRMLIARGAPNSLYNVGSGINRSSGEVLDVLCEIVDPRRAVLELWPGRRQDPIADTTRLTDATGWQPEIPLEVTVRDTLEDWCERLARRPRGMIH